MVSVLKDHLAQVIALVVVLVLLAFLPLMTSQYMLHVSSLALISFICVLSAFLIFGLCGQISFAQAGLWGVGAYAAAIATTAWHLTPVVALLFAIVLSGVAALVIGVALFRLKGHYFGFATIGIIMVLNALFQNWTPVTGGANGIVNIPSFGIGGLEVTSSNGNYFLILIFAVVAAIIAFSIHHSSLGRSFMAVRDNEIAARCMGVNSFAVKNIAFTVGGMMCGLAGALYAFLNGYIDYTTFTFSQSGLYLVMVMVGGYSSVVGAAIGTGLLTLLPEWFRFLQGYMMFIFGAGVIVLMVVMPDGIFGLCKKIYSRVMGGGKNGRVQQRGAVAGEGD